jgi:hypothetical protein
MTFCICEEWHPFQYSTYYERGECIEESIPHGTTVFARQGLGMTNAHSFWALLLLCAFHRQRSAQPQPWSMCNGLLDVRAPYAYSSYASAQFRQYTPCGSYDVFTEGQLEQPGILQAKNVRRSLPSSQRLL